MYAKVMELNYWHSTECRERSISRRHAGLDGDRRARRARRSCCGPGNWSWRRACPACRTSRGSPGPRRSEGTQHHSSQFRGLDDYRGKKCVVLGSNNSAHDICAALWEQDADVTMIQRSSTHVARSDTLMELALGRLYSESAVEAGITTDIADLLFASIPYRIMPAFQIPVYREIARSGCRPLRASRAGGVPARFRRRRLGAVHEVPATRIRLLHRCGGLGPDRRRQDQAPQRRHHRARSARIPWC